MPGSRVQQINSRAEFQSEARAAGGIHLSNNHHLAVAGHRQVARLARFVRHFFHQWARLGHEPLQRMVPVREFKKFQRQLKALVGQHLRNIAALGEANEHAENFADGAAQTASDLAGGEPLRLGCKKLQDI